VQDEARLVCEQIGDRGCVGKAWRVRGNERFYYGDFQGAQEAYARGLAITRELGDRSELANLLAGFSVLAKANRDWARAEGYLKEAVSTRVETGYNPGEVETDLAEMYVEMGRLPDAERTLDAALESAQRAGAHEELGEVYRLRSLVARAKGQLDGARQLADRALAELRAAGNPLFLWLALAESSSLATARGDLETAERDMNEAGSSAAPEIEGAKQLARAELWSARGRLADAAAEAQRAAASLDKGHADEQSARALLAAADALEMLHQDESALAQCREAAARAARSPNPVVGTLAQLCAWRLGVGAVGAAELPARASTSELKLAAAYARAMRARHAGTADYRRWFADLASQAEASGYMTLAKRARSLAAE